MKRLILMFIFFTIANLSYGSDNNITIYGKITNNSGEVLPEAAIIVRDSNNVIIKYTLSDSNGKYTIEIQHSPQITLTAQFLGYKKAIKKIELTTYNKHEYKCDFKLIDDFTLPEVVVISEVEPDTVNMKLDKFLIKEDDELKKILTRNPNFNIGNDGTIVYKGKNIDKILVNGKETFDNQNSIALDNIKADMISGLQIVNNYKDPFNMTNDEFETVLNLKSKNPSAAITTSNIEAAYGIKSNYKVKGNIMRFSNVINGFIVENANNINENVISLRELTNLFNINMPISSYFIDGLNNLFEDKTVSKKDISNTSFSIKGRWNEKTKLNTSFYYIYDNYHQDMYQQNQDSKGSTIYDSNKSFKYKSNTLLLSSDFSHKISPKLFINYKLRTIYILPAIFYNNDYYIPSKSNNNQRSLFELREQQQNFGAFNQLNLQYKLSLNSILEFNLFFNRESNKITQYSNSKEIDIHSLLMDFYYDKKNEGTSIKWTYSSSKNTSIYIKDEFLHTNDIIRNSIYSRNTLSNNFTFGSIGNKIKNKFSYEAQINLLYKKISTNSSLPINNIFLPYKIKLEYENRLHRFNIQNSLTYNDLDFKYKYPHLQNGTNIFLTNQELFNKLESTLNFSLSYNYNNIFKGKNAGIALNLNKYRNKVIDKFIGVTTDGINLYEPTFTHKYIEFNPSIFYSFTILQFSKFPVTISSKYDYLYASIIDSKDEINLNNHEININISSISKKNFNLGGEFKYNISKENLSGYNISYKTLTIIPKISYSRNYFDSELSYTVCKTNIYNNHINKYLDLKIGFNINKIQLNVISHNLEKILGLYNKNNYKEAINIQNGIISYSYVKDLMSYLMFQVKFKI